MKKVKIIDFDGTKTEYLAECPYCGIEVSFISKSWKSPIVIERNHCPHFVDVNWYNKMAAFESKDYLGEVSQSTEGEKIKSWMIDAMTILKKKLKGDD